MTLGEREEVTDYRQISDMKVVSQFVYAWSKIEVPIYKEVAIRYPQLTK